MGFRVLEIECGQWIFGNVGATAHNLSSAAATFSHAYRRLWWTPTMLLLPPLYAVQARME